MTSYARIPSATLALMTSSEEGDPETRRGEAPAKQRQSAVIPTMRDIARVAGVSQSTVSRVLNDAPTRVPIAADTRERVMVAARELGYRPNPHARSLRGASTMLFGAVLRDFSDPFFATVIEALAVQAMARGYNIVLGHAHGRVDEGIAFVSGRLPGDNWQRQDAFTEFMRARFGGVPEGYVQSADNSLAGGEA